MGGRKKNSIQKPQVQSRYCKTYSCHNVVVQAVDKVHEFNFQEKHPVNLLVYGLFGCALFRLAFFLLLSSCSQICGKVITLRSYRNM